MNDRFKTDLLLYRNNLKEDDQEIIKNLNEELTNLKSQMKYVYEKDKRLSLNFGHTFAHAIEMATQKIFNKEIFRHGEAVGIGILCELYLFCSTMAESKTHIVCGSERRRDHHVVSYCCGNPSNCH